MKSIKAVSALLLLTSLACGIGKDDEALDCGEGTHEEGGECVANPDMGYDDDSGRDSGDDSGDDSGADSGDSGTDSGDSGDSGEDSDTQPPAPTLYGIDPGYGVPASMVTISGTDLANTTSVELGGIEASVESVGDDYVSVYVPSGLPDGELVDVTVTTTSGDDTLLSAFAGFDQASGLTAAIGELEWYHYLGDYWDGGVDAGTATIGFITPDSLTYADLYTTAMDDCESNFSGVTIEYNDFGADALTLVGGSRDVTLLLDVGYFAAEMDDSQWEVGTSYELEDFEAEWGTFSVAGLARTPSSFNVTSPALDAVEPPALAQNELAFRWSGSGGDGVIVLINLYNAAQTSVVETVSCVANDDGSFTVPTGTFRGWGSGRLIEILVGRYVVNGAMLPYNEGTAEVAGIYWNVGAAWTE